MNDTSPYTVPRERGRWRAPLLAAIVHAALFLMLWIGVNWQSETPGTIEAEVWSPQPELAAPRPKPQSEPKPEPPPAKEEPRPAPPPPPPPREEPKPEPKPDIALEQEKKRKEEAARKKAEDERQRKEAEERKRAAEERQRLEDEKRRKEAEERRKAEAEKKRKEEEARKKAEEERKRKEVQDEAAREKARQDELRRLSETAGTGGSGQAARSRGSTDAGYAGKIRALIISNTVFNVPPTLMDNPAVEYAVELLPDGSLRSPPRKLKSSGVPGFDEAVLRAIEKSQPFPPDKQGVVPSSLTISHRPKDQ